MRQFSLCVVVTMLCALPLAVPTRWATLEAQHEAPKADSTRGAEPAGEEGGSDGDGEAEADDLSAWLEPLRAEAKMPGAALLVLRGDGRVLARGVAGVRQSDAELAVQPVDRWHLGSCTKAMTATLYARLVERDVVRWDTTIGQAFAGAEWAENIHADYRDVPLIDLLAHRGGTTGSLLADYRALFLSLRVSSDPLPAQRDRLSRAVLSSPPAVAPGSEMRYSNAGYIILGAALERATGKSWEELMRAEVFEPLGMTSAGFGPPGLVEPRGRPHDEADADAERREGESEDSAAEVEAAQRAQPWGHRIVGEELRPVAPGPHADNPLALGPAGTVHASLADWGRFVAAHLRGALGEPSDFLTADSFARLHAPWRPRRAERDEAEESLDEDDAATPASGYALGWRVAQRHWAGGRMMIHSGSNTIWYALAIFAPERDIAILVATNRARGSVGSAVDRIAGRLVQRYAPTQQPDPREATPPADGE